MAAPAATSAPRPVTVRQNVNKLDAEMQGRFVRSLKRLMETSARPGDSAYARLASHHGQHCVHGRENFGTWHRAYLEVFERELQRADAQLHGEAAAKRPLGLPYWDWSQGPELPPLILREFAQMPPGLVAARDFPQLAQLGYSRISARLPSSMSRERVGRLVNLMLSEPLHSRFASTDGGATASLEGLHNDVHVGCGYPMSNVDVAAFHPIFFLHHANIDRLYSAYLRYNPDSEAEFRASGELTSRRRQGRANPFAERLVPFVDADPALTTASMLKDTAAAPLGYTYDELPPRPQMRLVEPLRMVSLGRVPVDAFGGRSYTVHVYQGAKPPAPLEVGAPGYLGWAGVFGVRGSAKGCAMCAAREEVHVFVDVSDHDGEIDVAALGAVIEDELGAAAEVPGLGRPRLIDGTDEPRTLACDLAGLVPANGAQARFAASRTAPLALAVQDVPGYLDAASAGELALGCLRQWTDAVGMPSPRLVADHGAADIQVHWGYEGFEGLGGTIARTDEPAASSPGAAVRVVLDAHERWELLAPAEGLQRRGVYRLTPVLLHEFGHALGLSHSQVREDAMSPFLNARQEELTAADKAALQRLYSAGAASTRAGAAQCRCCSVM